MTPFEAVEKWCDDGRVGVMRQHCRGFSCVALSVRHETDPYGCDWFETRQILVAAGDTWGQVAAELGLECSAEEMTDERQSSPYDPADYRE